MSYSTKKVSKKGKNNKTKGLYKKNLIFDATTKCVASMKTSLLGHFTNCPMKKTSKELITTAQSP